MRTEQLTAKFDPHYWPDSERWRRLINIALGVLKIESQ